MVNLKFILMIDGDQTCCNLIGFILEANWCSFGWDKLGVGKITFLVRIIARAHAFLRLTCSDEMKYHWHFPIWKRSWLSSCILIWWGSLQERWYPSAMYYLYFIFKLANQSSCIIYSYNIIHIYIYILSAWLVFSLWVLTLVARLKM